MGFYYSYRKIDSYGCPLKVIISRRGLGKTFGALKDKCVWRFIEKNKRFIYVVETREMVKFLTQNHGEKFFSAIIEFCKANPSSKNNKIYNALAGSNIDDYITPEQYNQNKGNPKSAEAIGGAIRIFRQTAGYIVAYDDYGNLKRNNFVNLGTIVFDEFIPEERDVRNLKDAYRLTSVVQSAARMQDVEIIMLANAIRADDPILERMGLNNVKPGEFRKIRIDGELFGVCHFVDNAEYETFNQAAQKTVANKFARLLGETNLDTNTFSNNITQDLLIPAKLNPNHLLCCLHGDNGTSVRIHATQDYKQYYVLSDYGKNTRLRYCIDQKNISPVVFYNPQWGDLLKQKYQLNQLRFESNTVYFAFKSILKIN